MTNTEAVIRNLLQRVHEISLIFGTLTDKAHISAMYAANPSFQSPAISETDIVNFKRIVDTGIMQDVWLNPPKGYRIHSFLIALKSFQHRQYEAQVKAQEDDMVGTIAEFWFTVIARHNGNIEEAKADMKTRFGSKLGDPDSNSKAIFNKAYKLAKKQWENHTNPQ